MRLHFLVNAAVMILVTASRLCGAVPAFPGAEGYGTQTPGGRGGRVIAVTSLEDSGSGTLREAVAAKGPRIVVFRVGGTIRLKTHLRITEPFITIAGQTAPGDGILLRDAGLYIQTHDVVVRFIRSRVGPSLNEKFNTQDSLQISSEGEAPYNVVVDHCSFSWSIDEGVGIRGPAHDITFSWNIIAESLRTPFGKEQIGKERSHSMGMILGGEPTRVSVHHNLMAHCNSRMPRIQGGRHDFVNNVVYDWGWLTGTFSRQPQVNFIGNYYKRGPSSKPLKAITEEAKEMGRIYVKGNRSHERPDDSLDEWEPIVNAPVAEHRQMEPFEMPPLTMTTAEAAYEAVLQYGGAYLPLRDPVDLRIFRNVRLVMGEKIDRPEQVGGYPSMNSGAAPEDTDGDGMPDDWELAHGFDPKHSKDGSADTDRDGYTNVEEYLQDLVVQGSATVRELVNTTFGDSVGPFHVVSTEGVELPVLAVGRNGRVYHTNGWFLGDVTVRVTTGGAGLSADSLMPARYRDQVSVVDGVLSFRVRDEGPRVIRLGDQPQAPLLVAGFELNQDSDDANGSNPVVIDSVQYGVVTGGGNGTRRMQEVLDACGQQAADGCIVYVGTGHHRVDMLRIPTGVYLNLARSAVLISSGEGTEGPVILFDGVERAGLVGPGVIDGRGSDGVRGVPLVRIRNSKSIAVEKIVLRDPAGAGIEVCDSEQVRIERTYIIAGDYRRETGGIRVDGSREVSVFRSFVSSSGTGITIVSADKQKPRPTEQITVRESVIMAEGAGIRVGPDTQAIVRNLLVRDTDIVDAASGIEVLQRDAGGIEALIFRDMTMKLRTSQTNIHAGRPFQVINRPSDAGAPLRNVLFDRVYTNAALPSRFVALGSAWLEDMKLWGVRIRAEDAPPVSPGSPEPRVFELSRVRGPQFRFLYVTQAYGGEQGWHKDLFDLHDITDLKAPAEEIFQLTPDQREP